MVFAVEKQFEIADNAVRRQKLKMLTLARGQRRFKTLNQNRFHPSFSLPQTKGGSRWAQEKEDNDLARYVLISEK